MFHKLLLILLLLTLPQTANAYWLESEPEPFSLREREHAPPSKGQMVFTIQDNFDLFTDKIDSPPLLLPNSDYFVPADIIDINLPLFGIFSHPVKPGGDPIANLLYANLKLKKILDDYVEIQKRAAELLGEESLTPHEGEMLAKNDDSVDKKPDEKKGDENTIYEKLHQNLISLTTSNAAEVNPPANIEQQNDSQAQPSRTALLSFLYLHKKTEHHPQIEKLNSSASLEIAKTAAATGNYSQSASKYAQQSSPAVRMQGQSNQYSGEISLPWVLELTYKIYNYLLSHKIQALFIGLFGLMIINVIFGSRH